jgi:integrase/recombinase XerD
MKSLKPNEQLSQIDTDEKLISLWFINKALTTVKSYATTAKQFFDYCLKGVKDVKVEDFLLWVQSLWESGYTTNSVSTKTLAIKSLFSFAWKIGYIPSNPTLAVKSPSRTNALNDRLVEQPDIKALLEAATPGRDQTLLKLIYLCGLRVSEALGVNWSDIRVKDDGSGQLTVLGKGNKHRTVLLNANLVNDLMALPRENEVVFTTRFNNRLDRHQLHRIVKAAAVKAGIDENLSVHWLRHAHAVHSLDNGCNVEVLMFSLGHQSLTTTSRYLHARPNYGSSQFVSL